MLLFPPVRFPLRNSCEVNKDEPKSLKKNNTLIKFSGATFSATILFYLWSTEVYKVLIGVAKYLATALIYLAILGVL